MDKVKELQTHLDSCFHETRRTSKPPSVSNVTCYMMKDGDQDEEERKQSNPSRPPLWYTMPSGSEAQTSQQRMEQLQAELEETRRWNDSLRACLDKGPQVRDTGVGGEEEGKATEPCPCTHQCRCMLPPENYTELKNEVECVLTALETEREQFRRDRGTQQLEFEKLQTRVHEAEARAAALENQLRTQTDGSRANLESLRQEIEQQQEEIEHLKGTIASLRGRAEAERAENVHLHRELSSLKAQKQRASPHTVDKTTLISSSLPDLSDSAQLSSRSMTDSWTSPPRPTTAGDPLDVSALIAKHEEIVRLNHELQRKCCERLSGSIGGTTPGHPGGGTAHERLSGSIGGTTPGHPGGGTAPGHPGGGTTPGHPGGGTTPGHGRGGGSERSLRVESTLKKEQAHSAQVDEMEGKLLKLETELREKEATLRRQTRELDARLKDTLNNNDILRSRLAETLGKVREKDEELTK